MPKGLEQVPIPPAHPEKEKSTDTNEFIESESVESDVVASPDISPTGQKIIHAANKVNDFLENRAINKAHGDALAEYRSRDMADYTDHLSELSESKDASYQGRDFGNMALIREDNRADRNEKIDAVKDRARRIGGVALRGLKTAGLMSLGAGVMAGEKAAGGVGFTRDMVAVNAHAAKEIGKYKVSSSVDDTKEAAKAKVAKVADRISAKMNAGKDAVQKRVDKVTDTVDATKETYEYRRQEAMDRKDEKRTRRYERHAKHMERRRKLAKFAMLAKSRGEDAVDKAQSKRP